MHTKVADDNQQMWAKVAWEAYMRKALEVQMRVALGSQVHVRDTLEMEAQQVCMRVAFAA